MFKIKNITEAITTPFDHSKIGDNVGLQYGMRFDVDIPKNHLLVDSKIVLTNQNEEVYHANYVIIIEFVEGSKCLSKQDAQIFINLPPQVIRDIVIESYATVRGLLHKSLPKELSGIILPFGEAGEIWRKMIKPIPILRSQKTHNL